MTTSDKSQCSCRCHAVNGMPHLFPCCDAAVYAIKEPIDMTFGKAPCCDAAVYAIKEPIDMTTPPPIPMRLTCEGCGKFHIDEGEYATKPHHTHACQFCGAVWRPAIECTVGVRFLPGFKNEPIIAKEAAEDRVVILSRMDQHARGCDICRRLQSPGIIVVSVDCVEGKRLWSAYTAVIGDEVQP